MHELVWVCICSIREFKGSVNSRFTIAGLNHLYAVSLLYSFEKKGEIRDICLVFQQTGNYSEQAIKEILRLLSRMRTWNLSCLLFCTGLISKPNSVQKHVFLLYCWILSLIANLFLWQFLEIWRDGKIYVFIFIGL